MKDVPLNDHIHEISVKNKDGGSDKHQVKVTSPRWAQFFQGLANNSVDFTKLPVHADNAAAKAAGLKAGMLYKNSNNSVYVVGE